MQIPPAGLDVVLSDNPAKDKVWAVWKDVKGREQRLYSKSHLRAAYSTKFSRVGNVSIPKIEAALLGEIKHPLSEKRKEAAEVLYTILRTGFRIGSKINTKGDVEAFGISTLLSRHVKIVSGRARLDFVGKKGVRNAKTLHDPLVTKILLGRKNGKRFAPLFDVSGSFCLNFLKEIAGTNDVQIKDLRTHLATEEARKLVKCKGLCRDEKIFRARQREIADRVSRLLGNTRAVTLNSYIDPSVWDDWRQEEWGEWRPKKLRSDE